MTECDSFNTTKAALVAGYLRIYDKELDKFVKLDGMLGFNEETHFKIKTRKDMQWRPRR